MHGLILRKQKSGYSLGMCFTGVLHSYSLTAIFVCAGIIAGAIGTLTGAGIAHCVKIGKNMGIVNWVTVMIAVVPLLGFFLTCPNVDVIGIGTQYTNK